MPSSTLPLKLSSTILASGDQFAGTVSRYRVQVVDRFAFSVMCAKAAPCAIAFDLPSGGFPRMAGAASKPHHDLVLEHTRRMPR